MIRILIFLLCVLFIVATVTFLSGIDSRIEAVAFGMKYSLHTGFIIGLGVFTLAAVIWFTAFAKDIMALPGKIRAKQKEARQERGMAALARGMESVMVGDAVDAQHHARIARRNLEQSSLTRLLTAQASQLAGDDAGARENFALMLEAPETEFLGLHGLYAHADRAGDMDAARQYAERAFKLRPNARWAFDSVMDLNLDRGAWGECRDVLKIAKSNRLINEEEARRGEAVLLTADAYAAGLTGDSETAQKEAETAFRLCPDLTPAAILAASAMADRGKKSRATKILEQSFAASPHPAIGKLYEKVLSEDTPARQASGLGKLAATSPDSFEARFLLARQDALQENWEDAKEKLETLIVEQPTAREFAAMAEAMGNAYGEDAARPWLERAASAPRNPEPGADGSFNFTKAGWARLVREYIQNARLAPPPLEDRPEGLTHEEIKLLAAPPLAPESEIDAQDVEIIDDDEKISNEPNSTEAYSAASDAENAAPSEADANTEDNAEVNAEDNGENKTGTTATDASTAEKEASMDAVDTTNNIEESDASKKDGKNRYRLMPGSKKQAN